MFGSPLNTAISPVSKLGLFFVDDRSAPAEIFNDGIVHWRRTRCSGIAHSGTPAISREGDIFIGADQIFYKLNGVTGAAEWSVSFQAPITSSAAIGVDGTIYVGSTDMSMNAISNNGTLLWTYSAQGAISSSPAIGVSENGGSLIFGSDGTLMSDLYYVFR